MPLWNSRFRKPLNDEVLKFTSSIEIDKRLYNDDIDGSIAHVRMLMKKKIVSIADGKAIQRGLERIRKEIGSGKFKINWRDEDVHTLIEERLVRLIGVRGKRLHAGRSRNDQVSLDERLYLRKKIQEIGKRIKALQLTLLSQAESHKKTIVPGYTHLQRAQPILFAHHLLAYVSMFHRDAERFRDCGKRNNRSTLGAAAFAGTSLTIDRRMTARLMGFDGIVENSIDAVSDRDFMIEFISACAITMMHLSRLSEEMVLWCSQEFGFARLDDAFATGSSLMPQKKNPDIPELIRGKTGRVYGSLVGLLTVMKALPLAYNRDMQEDKVHLFETVDTTEDSLRIAALMMKNTVFRPDGFERQLKGDFTLATDLAEYLVRKGVPFRRAHSAVGNLVALCDDRRCLLHELSLNDYKKATPSFKEDVFQLLHAGASVKGKRSEGSTSPDEVEKALRRWKKRLK
ncbi:MAG: argininosuccinate lyase [Bacteroidetes bacterium]|nr:argininosuccinate lyase [Bacteroidota bacterium]MCW5896112.1 argininosuccinate lyase [Bacteroidota bacterium]